MSLAIVGMHRSGTSMVAQLLQRCGLDLGPPEELLPPGPDNPDGFFENSQIVVFNETLLRRFGGAWSRPPTMPAGWERSPELLVPGFSLVGRFAGREPFGWKDPRGSLVLPIWRRLLPDLRVLACVRHPLAVARSLVARGDTTIAGGLALWHAYNERLWTDAPPDLVVTDYDAYFDDPPREIARVVRAVGLPASQSVVRAAAETVKPRLRHHDPTRNDLLAAGASPALVARWEVLRAQAREHASTPDDNVHAAS
jgi:hypothetical protein